MLVVIIGNAGGVGGGSGGGSGGFLVCRVKL